MEKTKRYFLFIKSKKAFEKAKGLVQLKLGWDNLLGYGWTATVSLSHEELIQLQKQLWNCKYTILKIKNL